MSARPTAPARRTSAATAVVVLLLAPTSALAEGKAPVKDEAAPAVCAHDLPPGLAKQGGELPPGVAKKTDGSAPPCDAPGGPRQGDPAAAPSAAPTTVTVVERASAAAPVVTTAASSAGPAAPCVGRKAFRLRLDKRGRVRRARVLLNGRAIPVTRGKRGRASVLVDLRKRIAGTYTVRTTVVTRKGRLVTGTKRYRVCG